MLATHFGKLIDDRFHFFGGHVQAVVFLAVGYVAVNAPLVAATGKFKLYGIEARLTLRLLPNQIPSGFL